MPRFRPRSEDGDSGRAKLGVPDDDAAKYLTPVFKRFAPKHSGVEIELDWEQSTTLIPRVASGELDRRWCHAIMADAARCCFMN